MLRRIALTVLCITILNGFACSVFAAEEGDFFGALQQNLPQATNTVKVVAPKAGEADTVIATSASALEASSSYRAYDAGQDRLSGYVAGGAAVFAALAVAFALGFVLTHRHDISEENSQH